MVSRLNTYNRNELLTNVTFRWDQSKQQFIQRKVDDENSKLRIIQNIDWNDVINKPEFYPPQYHTHTIDEIISFEPFERVQLKLEYDVDPFEPITLPEGKSYSPDVKNLMVIRDGVFQKRKESEDDDTYDYVEIDSTHVQFSYKIQKGSIIEFIITRLPPTLSRVSVKLTEPLLSYTAFELPEEIWLRVNGGNLLVIRDGLIQKPRSDYNEDLYDYIEIDNKHIMFTYPLPQNTVLDFIVLNIFW